MAIIRLEGMDFYSYHGHFAEEQILGADFQVDLVVETDTTKAEKNDNLSDTLDYQKLFLLVVNEMKVRSKLLENIAARILNAIKEKFPEVVKANITVAKLNPPLGGKIKSVSVSLNFEK